MAINRITINPYEHTEKFFRRASLLVTMGKEGKPNVMSVLWRSIGQLWMYPVITVAVSPSRYSFELLTKGIKEFTLNVPSNKISNAIDICGEYSGRDTDKFKLANLSIIPGKKVKVPTIKDSLLSYECKIIHETDSGNIEPHHLFFGEILAAFALKE
jgi:flavin reductase (DIM6/NTAB) family NADH-FMN oxidoreductase RutF